MEKHNRINLNFEDSNTKQQIKKTFCNFANEQEFEKFYRLCWHRNLDPFLGEVFFIKNIDFKKPVEPQVSKSSGYNAVSVDAIINIAKRDSNYLTYKSGYFNKEGQEYDLPVGEIYGAWCQIITKDGFEHPKRYLLYEETVPRYKRYDRKTGVYENFISPSWVKRPFFMLEKCVRAFAHKVYINDNLGGLQIEEIDHSNGSEQDSFSINENKKENESLNEIDIPPAKELAKIIKTPPKKIVNERNNKEKDPPIELVYPTQTVQFEKIEDVSSKISKIKARLDKPEKEHFEQMSGVNDSLEDWIKFYNQIFERLKTRFQIKRKNEPEIIDKLNEVSIENDIVKLVKFIEKNMTI